jgi:drug/metabolite transporter (DMT)-like permease
MTRLLWIVLILYPVAVGAGQILFKLAAERLQPNQPIYVQMTEPMLLSAIGLYGGLAIIWMLIVRELPLSAAYPFVALSFVFTPLFAWALLGEKINPAYMIGIAFICVGVFITQRAVHAI